MPDTESNQDLLNMKDWYRDVCLLLLYYIIIIITILIIQSLFRCYKLLCLVLCMCLFHSFTRAHFVLGLWAIELARK
jgi:hypothetical protein